MTTIQQFDNIWTSPQKKKSYNGYLNWNQWNVALWLDNDPDLYTLAQIIIKDAKSISRAAYNLQRVLNSHTPDGARYSMIALKTYVTENWNNKGE